MQSEETFNNNIVDSFFSFPTAICMHYFDKHNKSYSHRNVADQRRFQQKTGNRFSSGARVKICFRTELKEQIGHKCSRVHGPSQLRLNLEFGQAVH
jgi:hypothetical protein